MLTNKEKKLELPDWYFNGYSVISETISSYLQMLCMKKTLYFSNDGNYLIETEQDTIPIEDLERTDSNLKQYLSNYESGLNVVREANKEFQLQHIEVAR